LDLAKTKIQQSTQAAGAGPVSALAQVVRTDGVRGLWAGATPVLLGSAPESALQLASHTWLIAFAAAGLAPGEAQLPLWSQVACGGLAGASTILVSNPMEVLRIRASIDQDASCLDNVKALGLRGLFSGWQAGLLRDVPFSAIYFPLCAGLKAHMIPFWHQQLHTSQSAGCTAAALAAGAVAAFATAPLDVIKTRVQASISIAAPPPAPLESQAAFVVAFSSDDTAQACGDRSLLCSSSLSSSSPGCQPQPIQAMTVPSVAATVRDLVEREGAEALWRGVWPRVARLAPCMTMTLFLFEHLHKLKIFD